MPLYSELIAGLKRGTNGRIEATITDDWLQGRTTYGGLTAALCLEAALELVTEEAARVRKEVPDVEVEVRSDGTGAAPAVLDAAEGAALVVVGTRGRGGFAGLVLGSISQQVAQHAPCPVVVVPDADRSPGAEG